MPKQAKTWSSNVLISSVLAACGVSLFAGVAIGFRLGAWRMQALEEKYSEIMITSVFLEMLSRTRTTHNFLKDIESGVSLESLGEAQRDLFDIYASTLRQMREHLPHDWVQENETFMRLYYELIAENKSE